MDLREDLLTEQVNHMDLSAFCIAESGTTIREVVEKMGQENVNGTLIVTGDDLVGILTDRDVLRKVAGKNDVNGRLTGVFTERDVLNRVACQVEDLTHAHVANFMTPEPFALKKDLPIKHALHLMSLHEFRHLPLVDDDFKPEGVISFRDVVHHLKERLA